MEQAQKRIYTRKTNFRKRQFNIRRREDWVAKVVRIESYVFWGETPQTKTRLFDEETLTVMEQYCSYFGCGKELDMLEKLSGDRCHRHPKGKVKGEEYL